MRILIPDRLLNYLEKLTSEYNSTLFCLLHCIRNEIDYTEYLKDAEYVRICINIILTGLSKEYTFGGQVSVDFQTHELIIGE